VGNEACERFSFYGMRGILTAFLVEHLLARAPLAARSAQAKEVFHLFVGEALGRGGGSWRRRAIPVLDDAASEKTVQKGPKPGHRPLSS
jgi:hypothetical protein